MLLNLTDHLSGFTVFTPGGEAVELAPLWAERPVVLALIRHFG